MSEKMITLPRAEQEATTENEATLAMRERLKAVKAFVEANPDSSLLPELAEQIRTLLETEPKGEVEVITPVPVAAEIIPVPPEELMIVPVPRDISVVEPPVEPFVAPSVEKPLEPPVEPASTVEPPAKHEGELKLSLPSFETARKMSNPLPNELIDGVLTGNLRKQGGRLEYMVKSYLDNVPVDASDKEFITNHDEVIQFRDELTDFVKDELKIFAPPSFQGFLQTQKEKFFARLETGKATFRRYVEGREKRQDLDENPYPREVMDFNGLRIASSEGNQVDLLENSMHNMKANIFIQREIVGRFVHWSSDEYVGRRLRHDKAKLTRRIYLNPRPQDSVKVFKDVIHALNNEGLAVKAKIYDRSSDSDVAHAYDDEVQSVRGDGILVYASEEDAEKVLQLVQQQYENHQESFTGRGLSSVPFELADGFGIGDEPTTAGTSLTSHRSDAIDRTIKRVYESGADGLEEKRQLFGRFWRSEALNANINPDNPAFNAR